MPCPSRGPEFTHMTNREHTPWSIISKHRMQIIGDAPKSKMRHRPFPRKDLRSSINWMSRLLRCTVLRLDPQLPGSSPACWNRWAASGQCQVRGPSSSPLWACAAGVAVCAARPAWPLCSAYLQWLIDGCFHWTSGLECQGRREGVSFGAPCVWYDDGLGPGAAGKYGQAPLLPLGPSVFLATYPEGNIAIQTSLRMSPAPYRLVCWLSCNGITTMTFSFTFGFTHWPFQR